MIAPWIVGEAAERIGWGNSVSLTVGFVLIALGLLLWQLPETSQLELEDTAAIPVT